MSYRDQREADQAQIDSLRKEIAELKQRLEVKTAMDKVHDSAQSFEKVECHDCGRISIEKGKKPTQYICKPCWDKRAKTLQEQYGKPYTSREQIAVVKTIKVCLIIWTISITFGVIWQLCG